MFASEGRVWYIDHMQLTDKQEARETSSGSDLTLILDRWPDLPEHVKAAVLALIHNAGRQGGI